MPSYKESCTARSQTFSNSSSSVRPFPNQEPIVIYLENSTSPSRFERILEKVAPFWLGVTQQSLGELFEDHTIKDRRNTQIIPFFLIMAFFSRGTWGNKCRLFYRVLQMFENDNNSFKRDVISQSSMQLLIRFLYRRHFCLIPPSQIDNILSFELHGYVPGIVKATYRNGKVANRDFTGFFKDISAYLHLTNNSPDLMLNNPELKAPIDHYISSHEKIEKRDNILEIKYESDGGIRRETYKLGKGKNAELKMEPL